MASIQLQNVRKQYDNGFVAVEDFNLDIDDKEFIILVGPSGCGKSTTMRMIAGLEDISSGKIKIGDTVVNDMPPKDRDVAMVFQDYALYPHLTVRDNMSLSLRLKKIPKDEINRRVQEAAKLLEIEHLLENKPKQMSGGQRQRVAMGRAIVRTPKVFMFDEPLSNLDPKLRNSMRVELKKLHQRLNTTIIYVTHDQVEAMTLGDRIVVMNHGIVQQVGKPLDLYNHPKNVFVASFIGAPQMNFFSCTLQKQQNDFLIQSTNLKIQINPEYHPSLHSKVNEFMQTQPTESIDVKVGIRAEDMKVRVGETAQFHNSVHATVEVLEPIAPEVYLHMKMDEALFIVRDEDILSTKVQPGENIEIEINTDRIHLFDAKEGNRLF